MAYKASSFLALVLISNIMLATTRQVVARNTIPRNSNTNDKKEPQFFFKDGGVFIPGMGSVGFPPLSGFAPHNPLPGGSGGAGLGPGPAGRSFVPGGDDNFVPNPGFEVPIPNPGNGGGTQAAVQP